MLYPSSPYAFHKVLGFGAQLHTRPLPSPQALSNSVWALAHTRAKLQDLDTAARSPGTVLAFLTGVSSCALRLLGAATTPADMQAHGMAMVDVERRFSCQVRRCF